MSRVSRTLLRGVGIGLGCLLVLVALDANQGHTASEVEAWAALRGGGHVALIRHADAPGSGDPPGFTPGDCSTQRNLGDAGRAQATRIGDLFRANGIAEAHVVSSQWCRCLDTANLMALGRVEELPALNSFFGEPERREPQTAALKAWLAAQDLSAPLILVTHQVNIVALAGASTRSGEIVVVRPGETGAVSLVGTIETD
ncbi:MAG: histidine phosphatase family protein [Alphaproteobacteria bacterium]